MIEVRNLKKYYQLGGQTIKAIDGISLKIKDGEFVAFIGPSGSGKSTLLNLIGGLDDPTGGEIIVNGNDISKYNDNEQSKYRNKHVGFVFQTYNLQPTLTALENTGLPLKFSRIPRNEREIMAKKALQSVSMSHREDHKPGELSGGESQRVCIARAMVNNPEILLADEPTGNLDSKTGEKIMKLLKDLNEKRKITILLVTHYPKHEEFADRTLYIRDGKIFERDLNHNAF